MRGWRRCRIPCHRGAAEPVAPPTRRRQHRRDVAQHGLPIGGLTFTSNFLTGGLFSYDGVHPTAIGYAYVDIYNSGGPGNKACWIFANDITSGFTAFSSGQIMEAGHYMGGTASHEVGHQMGLSHQSGAGIMNPTLSATV